MLWERACSRLDRRGVTDTPRRCHREQARSHRGLQTHASLAFNATGLGLRNTSTLPSITSTNPANAGGVHW